ncbi:putative efflux pump antibiotic resistance protein [Cadophora sp. DSE1049]|nr:putative efflux pump antibiotic resistance protein [Cadophora sp. DSE1049]
MESQESRKRDHHEDESTPLLPVPKDYQSHILSQKRLLTVFPALALVQFTSFLDQTAISTSLPAIAAGLNTGSSISWVACSFLTTSTSIQLTNGRFSDIFGRKTCLVSALLIMGLGNLLSGFSQTPAQLYATRAFSGLGAGAINALVQITISDITSLDQRGYYFGIVGIAVAFGNGLGPVVGGALTEHTSWRWAFWFICPLTAVAVTYLLLVLPGSSAPENVWMKIKMVDWIGVLTSMAAIILILIPLSKGGSAEAWKSVPNIALFLFGLLLFTAFILLEFQFVKLPILPLRLFRYGASTNILIAINVLIGWVYWGNLFYIPLYLQVVRGWSPSIAGSFILPLVIAHGMTSGLSGIIMSISGRYTSVISGGAALWAIGACIKVTYGQETPVWLILCTGVLEGIGVGCSLQPVLIGLLAGSNKTDRAAITGLRNFVRDIGSAVGITVSGSILNSIMHAGLKHRFSSDFISKLTSSAFSLPTSGLSDEDKALVSSVYMQGIHGIFISYAVICVILFVSTRFIEDYGLAGRTEQEVEQVTGGNVNES